MRSTAAWLYRRLQSERPDGSLGDTSLDVLIWLHRHGPLTLTELSEHGQAAPASMSHSVNRLTSAGYAIRTPDPKDRRKVLFRTTPDGDDIAVTTQAQRHAWLDTQLRAISADDQRAIARACALLSVIADS